MNNVFRKMSVFKHGRIINIFLNKSIIRALALSQTGVFDKQELLLNRILKNATKHCPYYKELMGDNKVVKIKDFPIVEKKDIMPRIDSFYSDKKEAYSYSEGVTGGSTGEPFHLLISGGYEYDFGLRKWKEYGYVKGDKILAFDGTKLPEDQLEKQKFIKFKNSNEIPFGSHAVSALYFNKQTAPKYLEEIISYHPDFFRGYPAFIYEFACFFEKASSNEKLHLKGIELTSESAFDYQIEKIKQVFNCPVFLQYGHTESCVFAYTYNEEYKYKVEPLYGYVEIVDENGNHVKEHEIGEVVVTSLYNYAMPLIRYKTGDLAEYGGKDKRYIYLNKVYGRTQDYIYDCNGNEVLLTALIFGQHCHALSHIVKWQIEQFENGTIIANIIRADDYSEKDEMEIFNQFKELGNVQTLFNYVDAINLTPRGKSKMLIQHINK